MPSKDRILHVSDTHLGRWQYKSDERRQDYADAFEQAIDIAIDENVDAVIHTGDLFDDPNPHSSTLNDAFNIIKKLDEHDIPFYAIVGNHERKRKAQWMDLIEQLEIAERLSKNPVQIGDVDVFGVDSVRKTKWDSIETFDLDEPRDDSFVLVCMHELLHPPVPEHIYAKSASVYETDEVLDKLDLSVDAVALGDYHERSRKDVDDIPFFYPGSTEKTAKDESDVKSVDILEIENGALKRNQKYLDTREFKTIEITVIDEMDSSDIEQKIEGYDIEDAVLEVILTGSTNASFTTQQVRNSGVQNGALIVDVVDKRDSVIEDFSIETAEENVKNIESVLDDEINKLELSETASKVEEIVRDTTETQTKSAVEQKSRSIVEEQAPSGENGDSE